MKFIDRIGEVKRNRESLGGYEMKIIKCNKHIDIIVEFQDKYRAKVHTTYNNFKKGSVKNPYHPNVYGVGYLGQGKYKASKNGKDTKAYKHWQHMLMRCYDPYYINKELTYRDCIVCEEWLCFQNFAKWFYKHYYEIEGERMALDKDILIKDNKLYSPETCIFVSHRINNLFTKSYKTRGEYPIGVCYHKASNKYQAQCSVYDKEKDKKGKMHLGLYNTIEEAFSAYKVFKEKYMKQIADEYKELIPKELYEAMYKYEVEIND